MALKILFTSNVTWAMMKFRHGVLQYLLKQGHQLYIVAPYDEFVVPLQDMGCHCIDIQLSRKGVNPIKDLKLTYRLYKIYRDIKPDIIFNYSIKPIIYGSFAAKLAHIKSVAVNIGLGYTFIHTNLISKISHFLYKLALHLPKEVWFINEDDRDEFVNRLLVDSNKTFVLPSEGVDINYFSPRQSHNSHIVFLLIARILWDKGIGEYYQAAKILKEKYPSVEFQLLGSIDDGNPKGIEAKVIEQWHNEGAINYLGYAKDVRDFISNATCIVLPSYREGKGMTLIEAGAMGKPLIATNVPGCKDIVKEGYNGFLCEVKNSISLADRMEKMINLDQTTLRKLGENAHLFMKEHFDERKVIAIYKEKIKQLYGKKLQ
ncbi:MAG: glycosyltransferase family 4 protein [Sulfurospirillaceae bacterium]|nr:glycosyltransferase family 4 protein [Sulfurospirillaceae bacterium]